MIDSMLLLLVVAIVMLLFSVLSESSLLGMFSSFFIFIISIVIFTEGLTGYSTFLTTSLATILFGVAAYILLQSSGEMLEQTT